MSASGPNVLRVAVACATFATSGACGGYAELPLPVREQATLVAEYTSLSPGDVGVVQLAADLPDVEGAIYVVSPPEAAGPGVTLENWAIGSCPGAPTPALDGAFRVCIALRTTAGVAPTGSLVGLVLDARAQGRRFTAVGGISTVETP